MKKVSFDFDSTLSTRAAQLYAEDLIRRGVDVWVVTSRSDRWHEDVEEVCRDVGIPLENIIYTASQDKVDTFRETTSYFDWHLDDDNVEIELINDDTNLPTMGIHYGYDLYWKQKCEKLLL